MLQVEFLILNVAVRGGSIKTGVAPQVAHILRVAGE